MNATVPSLDNLHDLAEPGTVPWWPPAPGWYVVGALLVVAAVFWTSRRVHRWRANAYRRAALAELASLSMTADAQRLAPALSELLKRTALAAYPRAQVAGLSGESWLAFLDRSSSGSVFTTGSGRALLAAYDPASSVSPGDRLGLLAAARYWIQSHRVTAAC